MRKILKLIEKNFKLVWKSKLFVLTILIGPLLLTLLLGWAFDNSKDYSIRVGVYSENYEGVKQDILENLENSFGVSVYDNVAECINSVKSYETHICVAMPDEIRLEGDELSRVVFYVDTSRVNLVWVVLDSLSQVFALSSQQLSIGMTSDLLGRLKIAENKSVELQQLMDVAVGQADTSVLLVEDITTQMALWNLAGAGKNIEQSLQLKTQAKNSLQNNFENIQEEIVGARSALDNVSNLVSGVDEQINQLKGKLDEIEKLTKEDNSIGRINELGGLLENVRNDFSALEKNVGGVILKNGEALSSLKKLEGSLAMIDGLIDGLHIAVSNLRVTRVDKITDPIKTEIEPVTTEKTYLGFIFPTLVMLMVVFVSVLLSSSLIMMEKKNRAFFRNWLSKGLGLSFVLSYFITNLFIVLVDVLVFVLIARFVFDIFINSGFLVLLILLSGLFVVLGSFIGLVAKNEQSNVLIGVGVSSILVFFSNTIIPIESASGFLKGVIRYNPFVVGESLLRKVLQGVSFGGWRHDFFVVVIYILVLVVVLVLVHHLIYEKKLR